MEDIIESTIVIHYNLNNQVRKLSTKNTPVFVFGGAEIYNLLLDKCDKLYISTFDNLLIALSLSLAL